MSIALLIVSLLTPWYCGYLLLRRARDLTHGRDGWIARGRSDHGAAITSPAYTGYVDAGYGFFLGYAVAAMLLWLSALASGAFQFMAVLSVLLLACVALFLTARGRSAPGTIARRGSAAAASPDVPAGDSGPSAGIVRLLSALLLLGIGLHLAFVFIEIVYRPVFPWDGWLNWMYRAKIWFYSGYPLPFSEPGLWIGGERLGDFNVDGAHYPPLVPLFALWAALGLGQWSETLVNLPVFLALLALLLGFYGQCRAALAVVGGSGRSRSVPALAACFALASLPLLGSHFALAGQADSWLACFAGLGIIALLRGQQDGDRLTVLLGLGFCLIGTLVKLEGALWLLLALMLMLGRQRPALASAAGIAVLGLLAALALLAPSWLPAAMGKLPNDWVPAVMSAGQPLVEQQLGDDYLQNYLLGGSWHLAGWLSLLCFAVLLFLRRRIRNPALHQATLFFALQGTALLLIFSYSSQGAWAEDWTAINRLPLQLIPVHIFLWTMLAAHGLAEGLPQGVGEARSRQRPVALLLSVLGTLAVLLALLWVAILSRAEAPGPGRVFPAETLRAVVGGGVLRGDALLLERYEGNLAIASSGSIRIDVARQPLVSLRTGGASGARLSFFWRSADNPEDLRQHPLTQRGTIILDLRDVLDVGGSTDGPTGAEGDASDSGTQMISEFGVLAYRDTQEQSISIGAIGFYPATTQLLLHKLWMDWTRPVYWSQKSAHWTAAGASGALLPLPLAAGLSALLLALGTLLIYRREPPRALAVMIPVVALLWLLLDTRWSYNLLLQSRRTLSDYPPVSAVSHKATHDGETAAAVTAALALRGPREDRAPLLILGERGDLRYQLLRAKYHAAPVPALVLEDPQGSAFKTGDTLLLLRSRYGLGDGEKLNMQQISTLLAERGLALSAPQEYPGAVIARVREAGPR